MMSEVFFDHPHLWALSTTWDSPTLHTPSHTTWDSPTPPSPTLHPPLLSTIAQFITPPRNACLKKVRIFRLLTNADTIFTLNNL